MDSEHLHISSYLQQMTFNLKICLCKSDVISSTVMKEKSASHFISYMITEGEKEEDLQSESLM